MCTPAVEAVVEANTLLSGLGFESGGLAGAHSVHNGMTVLPPTHARYHGQKVTFGLITQLVMEGRPSAAVTEVLDFCLSVGLPVCLEDIGIPEPSREDIRQVAECTTAPGETIHATWFPVTADIVESAIWGGGRPGPGAQGTRPAISPPPGVSKREARVAEKEPELRRPRMAIAAPPQPRPQRPQDALGAAIGRRPMLGMGKPVRGRVPPG